MYEYCKHLCMTNTTCRHACQWRVFCSFPAGHGLGPTAAWHLHGTEEWQLLKQVNILNSPSVTPRCHEEFWRMWDTAILKYKCRSNKIRLLVLRCSNSKTTSGGDDLVAFRDLPAGIQWLLLFGQPRLDMRSSQSGVKNHDDRSMYNSIPTVDHTTHHNASAQRHRHHAIFCFHPSSVISTKPKRWPSCRDWYYRNNNETAATSANFIASVTVETAFHHRQLSTIDSFPKKGSSGVDTKFRHTSLVSSTI